MQRRVAPTVTALALGVLVPACGMAEGISAVVPEFNAYVKLSDRARMYALAQLTGTDHTTEGDLGVHFDYTLQPILRTELRDADWERNRYLWMRAGYQRLGTLDGDDDAPGENRWLVEMTARFELAGELWLVNRLRLDLRDVGSSHSRRYRYRIAAEKEFSISGVPCVPYVNAEWFYDTRFDTWSRQLYQGGVEIELNKSWRLEPYYEYEKNTNSGGQNVGRIGLVLKYYR